MEDLSVTPHFVTDPVIEAAAAASAQASAARLAAKLQEVIERHGVVCILQSRSISRPGDGPTRALGPITTTLVVRDDTTQTDVDALIDEVQAVQAPVIARGGVTIMFEWEYNRSEASRKREQEREPSVVGMSSRGPDAADQGDPA